jgi:hypothetical protein
MKWPVALGIVVASALPVLGQTTTKAGVVLDFKGRWCRQAAALRSGDVVNLEDTITYCAEKMDQTDKIVIRFDGEKSYDRPYLCSTPGICDTRAKLWLAGAYALQHLRSPGGVLQSAPRISSLTYIDELLQSVEALQTWTTKVDAAKDQTPQLKLKTLEYCRLDNDGKATGCSPRLTFTAGATRATAYGAFLKGERHDPISVVGVVPGNSVGLEKWSELPDFYKVDANPQVVLERRAYILQLLKSPNRTPQ